MASSPTCRHLHGRSNGFPKAMALGLGAKGFGIQRCFVLGLSAFVDFASCRTGAASPEGVDWISELLGSQELTSCSVGRLLKACRGCEVGRACGIPALNLQQEVYTFAVAVVAAIAHYK